MTQSMLATDVNQHIRLTGTCLIQIIHLTKPPSFSLFPQYNTAAGQHKEIKPTLGNLC